MSNDGDLVLEDIWRAYGKPPNTPEIERTVNMKGHLTRFHRPFAIHYWYIFDRVCAGQHQ